MADNVELMMAQTGLLVGDVKLEIPFTRLAHMSLCRFLSEDRTLNFLLFIGVTNKHDVIVTGVANTSDTLSACGPQTYKMDFVKVLTLEEVLKCTHTSLFFKRKTPGLNFLDRLGRLIDSIGGPTGFDPMLSVFNRNKLAHLEKLNFILNVFEDSNFNKHPSIKTKLVSARQELKALKDNAYGVYSSPDMKVEP